MVVREVVIPTSPEKLWDALTAPDRVAAWFGSQVEWDLRPGGRARFADDDGTVRHGVVEAVRPGRHLSFRWWRDGDGPPLPSQVSYDLDPDEAGTRLTVTEQPVDLPAPVDPDQASGAPAGPVATSRSASSAARGAAAVGSWTAWDDRLFRGWATATATAGVRVAVGVR